jgi:glutathione S-transferase
MAGDAFSLADISAYTIEVFLNDQIAWSAASAPQAGFDLVRGRPSVPTVGAPNGCHPAGVW